MLNRFYVPSQSQPFHVHRYLDKQKNFYVPQVRTILAVVMEVHSHPFKFKFLEFTFSICVMFLEVLFSTCSKDSNSQNFNVPFCIQFLAVSFPSLDYNAFLSSPGTHSPAVSSALHKL
jgi:hypothetical protein